MDAAKGKGQAKGQASKSAREGSGVWSLFGSRAAKKVKAGNLGDESTMYYNKELNRWVERGKEAEAAEESTDAPPPIVGIASAASEPSLKKSLAGRYVLQNNLPVSRSSSLLDASVPVAGLSQPADAAAPPPGSRFMVPAGVDPKPAGAPQFFVPGAAVSTGNKAPVSLFSTRPAAATAWDFGNKGGAASITASDLPSPGTNQPQSQPSTPVHAWDQSTPFQLPDAAGVSAQGGFDPEEAGSPSPPMDSGPYSSNTIYPNSERPQLISTGMQQAMPAPIQSQRPVHTNGHANQPANKPPVFVNGMAGQAVPQQAHSKMPTPAANGHTAPPAMGTPHFERLMHPGGTHKLDGPLPWELPEELKQSDQFISICSNWQKQNPGMEYSHDLLLAAVSPSQPSPTATAVSTGDGNRQGWEAASAHQQHTSGGSKQPPLQARTSVQLRGGAAIGDRDAEPSDSTDGNFMLAPGAAMQDWRRDLPLSGHNSLATTQSQVQPGAAMQEWRSEQPLSGHNSLATMQSQSHQVNSQGSNGHAATSSEQPELSFRAPGHGVDPVFAQSGLDPEGGAWVDPESVQAVSHGRSDGVWVDPESVQAVRQGRSDRGLEDSESELAVSQGRFEVGGAEPSGAPAVQVDQVIVGGALSEEELQQQHTYYETAQQWLMWLDQQLVQLQEQHGEEVYNTPAYVEWYQQFTHWGAVRDSAAAAINAAVDGTGQSQLATGMDQGEAVAVEDLVDGAVGIYLGVVGADEVAADVRTESAGVEGKALNAAGSVGIPRSSGTGEGDVYEQLVQQDVTEVSPALSNRVSTASAHSHRRVSASGEPLVFLVPQGRETAWAAEAAAAAAGAVAGAVEAQSDVAWAEAACAGPARTEAAWAGTDHPVADHPVAGAGGTRPGAEATGPEAPGAGDAAADSLGSLGCWGSHQEVEEPASGVGTHEPAEVVGNHKPAMVVGTHDGMVCEGVRGGTRSWGNGGGVPTRVSDSATEMLVNAGMQEASGAWGGVSEPGVTGHGQLDEPQVLHPQALDQQVLEPQWALDQQVLEPWPQVLGQQQAVEQPALEPQASGQQQGHYQSQEQYQWQGQGKSGGQQEQSRQQLATAAAYLRAQLHALREGQDVHPSTLQDALNLMQLLGDPALAAAAAAHGLISPATPARATPLLLTAPLRPSAISHESADVTTHGLRETQTPDLPHNSREDTPTRPGAAAPPVTPSPMGDLPGTPPATPSPTATPEIDGQADTSPSSPPRTGRTTLVCALTSPQWPLALTAGVDGPVPSVVVGISTRPSGSVQLSLQEAASSSNAGGFPALSDSEWGPYQLAALRADMSAELGKALVERTAQLESAWEARAEQLQVTFDARLAEVESSFEARVVAVKVELQAHYEQQLAVMSQQLEAHRDRGEATQVELDELMLCLGQESNKVGALCDAMRAAGLDPDATTDPIDAEYAVMGDMALLEAGEDQEDDGQEVV